MKSRVALSTAGAWPVITVVLIVVPLARRDRLPDPLATHWSDTSPDGHQSFGGFVLFACGMWLALVGVAALVLLWGLDVNRRWARALYGAVVGVSAGLALGAEAMIIKANLDRASWREGSLEAGDLWLLAASVAGLGLIGWLLGRLGPDMSGPEASGPRPAVLLGPGERGIWYSRIASRWVPFAVAVVALVSLITLLWAPGEVAIPIAVSVVAIAVFGSMLGSVSAAVNERGLTVTLGWLGWPRFRIPLRRIERAWAEERSARAVGGWGLRGVPGAFTVMLRSGECLMVRHSGGKEFAVSIDDAERGAGLINTLRSETD